MRKCCNHNYLLCEHLQIYGIIIAACGKWIGLKMHTDVYHTGAQCYQVKLKAKSLDLIVYTCTLFIQM